MFNFLSTKTTTMTPPGEWSPDNFVTSISEYRSSGTPYDPFPIEGSALKLAEIPHLEDIIRLLMVMVHLLEDKEFGFLVAKVILKFTYYS